MAERGAREDEIAATIAQGERFPGKFGRTGFRRNFRFDDQWRGRFYKNKQLEVLAVLEEQDWPVIAIPVSIFERDRTLPADGGERIFPRLGRDPLRYMF
jgi:hypothetical protein